MNDKDTESAAVLAKVRDAFDGVTMPTPLSDIIAIGHPRRRRRRLVRAGAITSVIALAAVGVAFAARPAPGQGLATGVGGSSVHVRTVAYTVDTQANGTIKLTWTKQAYIQDPSGLQAALRRAGFPVLIKVGEFCKGPGDDGYLDPSGQGRGVGEVMRAGAGRNGTDVVFTFYPRAMPAGTELFIGYLTPAQLAITRGRPGSVERLVPTGKPVVCTTQAPPAHAR
jgi:hypothetical protein